MLEPRYVEAQGPILSFKVPSVKIGAAYWTLPALSSEAGVALAVANHPRNHIFY